MTYLNQAKGVIKQIRTHLKSLSHNAASQGLITQKIQASFDKQGIPKKIAQGKVSDLENDSKNLSLIEGLAMASALDTFMAKFIKEEILALGAFEVRMLSFNKSEVDEYFMKLEKHNRIAIFSNFPSYIYHPIIESNNIEYSISLKKKRYHLFLQGNSFTHEFYTLETLLNFVFSQYDSFLCR